MVDEGRMHLCIAVLVSIFWAARCSSYRSHFEDTKEVFHEQRPKAAVFYERLSTKYLQNGASPDASRYRSAGWGGSLLATVKVRCGQASMVINASADLFNNGRRVSGGDIRLGRDPAASGACRPAVNISAYYVIDTALHACGSSLLMTSDKLVYTNVLVYTPSPSANGVIVRTNGAVIPIECHYRRKHNVSSQAVKPTWIPFSSTKSAGNVLEFSLRLMSDDWVTPRISNVFYLNDPVRIEGSVSTQNHLPMRLFIDRCVATLRPEQDSSPRYAIIDYNGCLVDGSSPDSSSVFRSPRIQQEKLQFSVPAFRFHRETSSLIYLTCHLKVAAVDVSPDSASKACSFNKAVNSWSAVEGSPGVCACCQTGSCPSSRARVRRDQQPVLDLTGKAFSFPYSSSFGSVNITSDQRNSIKNFTLCFQYQPSAGSINPLFYLYPSNDSCSFSLSRNYDRQYRLYVCGNTLSFCCSSVFQDFPGWVRVCVTWDSRTSVAQLWENGKGSVRKGLDRPIWVPEEGTPNVILNSGSSPFQISDINLWDRELTPWEIMAHGAGNVLSWESVWYTTRGATLLESKR